MQFIIKNNTGQSIDVVMRDLRYHAWGNVAGEQKQFIRPLATGDAYPRFHIYLQYNSQTKDIALTLHFDQRQAVYQGTTAHHGDYDGEIVEKEAERIKNCLLKLNN
ncbi:MAG: hypothetical protein NTZ42_01495 [Candidatus Gribaldobacteria bacterium]|nr:hypothetical protein [Candidatus Gribaldobacteria bacterium]